MGRGAIALIAAALLSVTCAGPAGASMPMAPIDEGVAHDWTDSSGPVPLFELYPAATRWRSHTITYFNTAKQFSGAVKKGAAAWNRSGVKARWKPVSKGAADVIVKVTPGLPASGFATSFNGNRGLIELNPNIKGKSADVRAQQNAIVAHEMGHIMGLDHENHGCATMNASLWSGCKRPKQAWLYRCRTLQADDVRGGIALFGGKARKLGKEFCASEPAPKPVTDLKAEYNPGGRVVELTWKLPKKKAPARVSYARGSSDGKCPKKRGKGVAGGRTGAKDYIDKVGTYCYIISGESRLGRPGRSVSVKVDVTGAAPEAGFYYYQSDVNLVEFSDDSYDSDDGIVSWQWGFGDGTGGSTERDPVHLFPGPGTYNVTLTVRDQAGNTDQQSEQVLVEEF